MNLFVDQLTTADLVWWTRKQNESVIYIYRGLSSQVAIPDLLITVAEGLKGSSKTDVLLLLGSPVISAITLWTWIEMHQECMLLEYGASSPHLVTRWNIRKAIEASRPLGLHEG